MIELQIRCLWCDIWLDFDDTWFYVVISMSIPRSVL